MQVNASIPLSARGIPPIESPTEVYGRAMKLKNLGQEVQLGQQRLQANQIALKEHELDLQDQQTWRDAYRESGGDLAKAQNLASARGLSPKFSMALNQQIVASKKAYADLDEAQLKATGLRNDRMRGIWNTVKQAPADQRPQIYAQGRAQAIREGLVKEAAQIPEAYPGDEAFDQFGNLLATGKQFHDEEMANRRVKAQETTAKAAETTAGVRQVESQWRQLGQTVPGDAEGWKEWRDSLPGPVKARVPAEYSEAAVRQVERMSLTPKERADLEERRLSREESARHNEEMEGLRYAWQQKGGMTPGQAAVQARADERELQGFQNKEAELHRLRRRLWSAIENVERDKDGTITGGVYVTRLGEIKSLESIEGESAKRAAIEDMQATFESATEQAKQIIADKNKVIERAGGTIKVPTEQAWREIDEPGKPVPGGIREVSAGPAGYTAGEQTKLTDLTGSRPGVNRPAAAPAAPAASSAKQQWTVNGITYSEGQEIRARGKRYRVTGFQNGKIQAQPLD